MMKFKWFAGASLAIVLALTGGCATSFINDEQAASPLSDTDIEHDVQDRLRSDVVTSKQTFGVSASSGVVTLTGSVKNVQVRARAMSIVEGAPGVTEVIDRMYR